MSDVIRINDGGAIDARFSEQGARIDSVRDNLMEFKTETKTEIRDIKEIVGHLTNGHTEHNGSITRMADDIKSMSGDLKKVLKALYIFIGALGVINTGFGIVIAYLIKVSG